jgi:hypothetical protein
MSQEHDDDWLDVLAGRPGASAGSKSAREASAIRTALRRRAEQLDQSSVPEAGEELYQKLLFRLRRERLAPFKSRARLLPALAIAATVVLGAAVVVQMTGLLGDQEDLIRLRGPDQGILIATKDPERRAQDLVQRLRLQGIEATVSGPPDQLKEILPDAQAQLLEPGRIVLVIPSSPSALAALKSQGIEAEPFQGEIRITFVKKAR